MNYFLLLGEIYLLHIELLASDANLSIVHYFTRSHSTTVLHLDDTRTEHRLIRMDEEWSTDIYFTQSSSSQQSQSAWDESMYFSQHGKSLK